MRDNRAKERLTLARQRHRLPHVTARMAAGDLSYGYAATLADSVARLTDGTPIPAEQARRIAMAAGVSPLLLGKGILPLYLGHRVRFATGAQRRVLESLYPTCAVRGCEVPGTLCEVDHVHGWALGRSPPDIDRLALCCGFHNRWKHANPTRIRIVTGPDGRHTYRVAAPPDAVIVRPPPWLLAA
jgi:hypothetical protein